MLSGKHANIGATVGMLKFIHKLTPDAKMAEELARLFMAEAESCDYGENRTCSFPRLPELAEENDARHACMVGLCPLGPAVDNEIDDRQQLYGKNTMGFGCDPEQEMSRTKGGHIHIGYTGWRKYWNMFKKWVLRR